MGRADAPREGDDAPDFVRVAADGESVRLSDFRGRRCVVLFFYPRDHTALCTAEACEFRDRHSDFLAADAVVIGISANSLPSHRDFAAKNSLPFPLLSDADGTLRSLYGVADRLWLIPQRVTFVIDRQGVIRMVFASMWQGPAHVGRALDALSTLQPAAVRSEKPL